MNTENTTTGFEIAVIGMACRFPGAKNIHEFWDNLKNGVESVTFFTGEELKEAEVDDELIANPNYVKTGGGVLENKEYFDASFFGYTPAEAEVMDPQMRIFHECVWEALEDAAYDPFAYEGAIGLYAGATSRMRWEALVTLSGKAAEIGDFAASHLMGKDFMNTRIAYKLNLKGPAIVMQTACSTSLAAIHMACRALLMGECDMALAGGVTVTAKDDIGYLYQKGMVKSPDGHCRAFDVRAEGFVGGSGAGAVLLKRLKFAAADNDHIYAVIKGSAVNNDGARKVGYTAPSIEGQVSVIKTALHVSKVDPATITYVETHGTATPLGDPVEIEALKQAFHTDKKRFCAIGSVKTNFGHLDSAAGAAGFIKTVLSLYHHMIPPSLHFETPNPRIDFENSPFYVNTRLKEWQDDKRPLRAGVSSFGIGGVNAHVLLEEWPRPNIGISREEREGKTFQLILWSARTESALKQVAKNLAEYLTKNPYLNLADIAYTLQVGRRAFKYRRKAVCSTVAEAIAALSAEGSGETPAFAATDEDRPVIFMFPGLGAQYVNMGLGLYESEPFFRQEMDRCLALLKPILGYDLKDILYPSIGSGSGKGGDINAPEISQMVIFIFEYSLAGLLMNRGIKPRAMIGYSFGEYTAACLASVFTLEDILKLIAARGELIRRTPLGRMLSTPLPAREIEPFLNPELSIAIDNGASSIVSGSAAAVTAFEQQMKARRILCMPLQTDRAVHSPMMESILTAFAETVRRFPLNKPRIPYISNVTGQWIKIKDAVDPRYWAQHLRQTVRFAEGISELAKEKNALFIEIGPARDLNALVKRQIENNPGQLIINLVRHPDIQAADEQYLANKVGELWLYGQTIDWAEFYRAEKPRRIPLPTYPFERQRYWIDGKMTDYTAKIAPNKKEKADFSQWFYLPLWKQSPLHPRERNRMQKHERVPWLVFSDGDPHGPGAFLEERLKQAGFNIITIRPGPAFEKQNETVYTVNPAAQDHYLELARMLKAAGEFPRKVVHLWGITTHNRTDPLDIKAIKETLDAGFYSILYLARAIREEKVPGDIAIHVITNDMQEIDGGENINPAKAAVLGAVKVIPQECPNIRCRSIDISLPAGGYTSETLWADQLMEESTSYSQTVVIGYRGRYRWEPTFEPLPLDKEMEAAAPLKERGVYLITGGLGNIGFTLARYLAENYHAKLILTGRTAVPPTNQKLVDLEALGAEVLFFRADAADHKAMENVIREAEERFGGVNGVIHCAGLVGENTVHLLSETAKPQCEDQFQAKIYGLTILEKLFRDKALDFCWLMSSIAAVLGGLRFAAYSAANNFMDAFVYRRSRTGGRWMAVNWDIMTPAETAAAFQRILALDRTHRVVVSTGGNLQARIDRWLNLESLRQEEETTAKTKKTLPPRPDVSVPYAAPRNSNEQALVEIFQDLFGFEKIGVHDDFFELGGDSLKAITVIYKTHKKLDTEIPLPEFFKLRTVEKLAQYINEGTKGKYTAIEPAEKKEYYPVSSAQNRFYILQQLEPQSTAYNVTEIKIIVGEPDRELLEKCFKALVRRHESLRTSFMLLNREPVQRIHPEAEPEICYFENETPGHMDSSPSLSDDWPRGVIKKFIRPFRLSRAPLIRAALIKTAEKRYLLVVDIHHIVTDGFSYEQLVKDFSHYYRSGGEELAPLRIQYKDFSQWQRRLWESEDSFIKRQETYWLKTFPGEIPLLDIPIDFPRPIVRSSEGAALKFTLDPQETADLKQLAQSQGVTLFILLLALFDILLYRLSGQEDIIVGALPAGRNHADLEQVIGVFLGTLALRNYPSGGKSSRDFLQDVNRVTLEAFENQDYPYEELVEKVVKKRTTGRNPLFDVMLILQNYVAPLPDRQEGEIPGKVGDLRLYLYEREVATATHDMSWFFVEMSAGELTVLVQYSIKLFKQETIRRFSNYFKNILHHVSHEPDVTLQEISILPDEEKKKILFQFNRTEKDFPRDKCFHQLFEAQVDKTPDYMAVRYNDRQMTYSRLNREANRAARFLAHHHVRPGAVAALYMKRSIDMLTSMIGVFKAGCAYLPIEHDYPRERIKYILENSEVGVVIAGPENYDIVRHMQAQLPNLRHVLSLAGEGIGNVETNLAKYPDHNLETPGDPHRLAYMIYTSGTTGDPKGVMIHQQAMVNHLDAKVKDYSLNPDIIVAQTTAATFDTSVWQFLAVLLAGGVVHIIDKEHIMDQVVFLQLLQKARITILEIVPSLLEVFLDAAAQETDTELKHLKWISPTGERLPVDLIARWFDRCPAVKVVNSYGPAEAADDTTQFVMEEKPPAHWKTIPIGKPLQNVHNYILDGNLGLCPIGVKGEICVAGVGVGKGYWKNPERTKRLFIPNPYAHEIGNPDYATLYRTGDIGFFREDGNIECLGRLDFQVKIMGNRVEPAEIESCLREYEGVKEAVVTSREKDAGEKYLCAYIVPQDALSPGKSLSILELREYLSRRLPAYMIPAYFVFLSRIPLTPNGKIDRRALPEPGVQIDKVYTAPRDSGEEKLAAAWARVLGIDKDTISIDADFFELGGNSIALIRLAGEINKTFNVEASVLELFNMPTIREIGQYLNRRGGGEGAESQRTFFHFNPGERATIFAFPPIIGYGLGYKALADSIPGYSLVAFHFIEDADRVEKYLRTIISIQSEGPYLLFGYSAGGGLAFETAKKMEALGHKIAAVIIMDAFRGDKDYSLIVDVGNPRLIAALTEAVEILGFPFVKEELLRKVRSYTEYYQGLVNDGSIAADIHLIRCADYSQRAWEIIRAAGGKEIEHLLSWKKSTRGRYFDYNGFGTHRDLFRPPHLEKNAALINNLLEKIGGPR